MKEKKKSHVRGEPPIKTKTQQTVVKTSKTEKEETVSKQSGKTQIWVLWGGV